MMRKTPEIEPTVPIVITMIGLIRSSNPSLVIRTLSFRQFIALFFQFVCDDLSHTRPASRGRGRSGSTSPQPAVAVPNPAQRQVQRIHVGSQPLRLSHINDLFLKQIRQMLIEALTTRFPVADRPLQL